MSTTINTCYITDGTNTVNFSNGSGSNDMCVPIKLTPGWNALDSAKTGRDNSTGTMFRDKVADKRKWQIELPYGLNQTQVAKILKIVKSAQYTLYAPDPINGVSAPFTVYTTSCEPTIALMTSASAWIYDAFSFNAIEF